MTSSDALAVAVRSYGSSSACYNPSFAENIEETHGIKTNFDVKYGFSEKPLLSQNGNILNYAFIHPNTKKE